MVHKDAKSLVLGIPPHQNLGGRAQESVFSYPAGDSLVGYGMGTPGVAHEMGIGELQGAMGRGGGSGVRAQATSPSSDAVYARTHQQLQLPDGACLPAANGAGQTPGLSNSLTHTP